MAVLGTSVQILNGVHTGASLFVKKAIFSARIPDPIKCPYLQILIATSLVMGKILVKKVSKWRPQVEDIKKFNLCCLVPPIECDIGQAVYLLPWLQLHTQTQNARVAYSDSFIFELI